MSEYAVAIPSNVFTASAQYKSLWNKKLEFINEDRLNKRQIFPGNIIYGMRWLLLFVELQCVSKPNSEYKDSDFYIIAV